MSINKIKPSDCREYALKNYSHIETAKKFVNIYHNVLKYGDVRGDLNEKI